MKRSIWRWVSISFVVVAGFRMGVAGAQDARRRGQGDAEIQSERNANLTDRTSYVISPDGKVAMVHSDLDWAEHVTSTLAAVRALNHS